MISRAFAGSLICAGLILPAAQAQEEAQDLRLHSLHADHAVIQRGEPIEIRGEAAPGTEIAVRLGEADAAATADEDGRWTAELPAMDAGGPYTLTAESEDVQARAEDVMIGDVWLCSGQSNMVLEVARALDAPAEIADSADDGIRVATIPLQTAFTPRADFDAAPEWRVAGPDSAAEFSAACFFMAQELRAVHEVPIGLIVAAWGGTRIEPWLSADAALAAGAAPSDLDALARFEDDPAAAMAGWAPAWEDWWLDQTGEDRETAPWGAELNDEGWREVPSLTAWETWGVPELAGHDGMVWYRGRAELTDAQAGQDAALVLGRADEVDQTWINGQPLGGDGDPGAMRRYAISADLLEPGEITVAVNVLDTWRTGGLLAAQGGPALEFTDGSRVEIGGWRWNKVDPSMSRPPRAPWDSTGGWTVIGNAMIAPLDGAAIKGAAWYQGESNIGDGHAYQGKLEALTADWRARFGEDLPVVVVQLAGFGPLSSEPAESGWAELREAQRRAVEADGHAALAVAVDIGHPRDIHPPDKQELARRMARGARRIAYGETGVETGPRPDGARAEGETVRIGFTGVTGALTAHSSNRAIGFELCGESGCRYADATVEGDTARIEGLTETDRRVRFCWADSPVCNVWDESGTPPTPFEMEIDR